MSFSEDPPLHDFPDRAIRRLLEDPHNLRDLLAAVLPERVDRFDFDHVEPVGREFLLENWRRRESDLLSRLPWRPSSDIEAVPPALVCVLIEHQSQPDIAMPLRDTLLEAARSSHGSVRRREEVERMAKTLEQTWEQELLARGEARGRAQGELPTLREVLLPALRQKFGTVPSNLEARVQSADDLHRLRAAFDRSLTATSLDDVEL
jgi:hypothetical protein